MRPGVSHCLVLLLVCGVVLCCPDLRAQERPAGTYRCARVNINGEARQCDSPPMVLNPDGTYRIWGEEGTYKIRKDRLILSHSKKRGPGHIQPNHEIVFAFTYKGKKHEVTFQRIYEAVSGSAVI